MRGDWREDLKELEDDIAELQGQNSELVKRITCRVNFLRSQLDCMDALTNRAELANEILAEWYVEDLPKRVRKVSAEEIIDKSYDEAVRRERAGDE